MKRQQKHPVQNPAAKRMVPPRPGKTVPTIISAANAGADFPFSPRVQNWLLGLLLVAATFLAYQPVWHAGFIWDDDAHLTANPCIVGPLGFWGIWTSSAATYYPLGLTTFWVQHALWGLNPLPYHLVNVAVHALCAILLWQVLRRLNIRGAWLGAALWALHPVQVESAAWITELKNTQSGFFYLLAILFFIKWRLAAPSAGGKRAEWHYALTLLCATLAILSKASTVMLPVVLGLCWWWLDGQWRWRNSFRLAPFFLISAVASGWTVWEQKYHSGALGSAWAQSWAERLVVSGKDVWFYLGKLLWPHPLIFIYPRWTIDAARPAAYLPVLAVVVTLFLLWQNRRRRLRPVFFAFAYFLVSLFPALDFFNVYFFQYSFVGDHFQYLASIGPLALAAAGITTAFGFLRKGNPLLKPALCGLLLLTLGALTWQQCKMYADVETLWRTTLDRNPAAWLAHNNLGYALATKGRVDEAIIQYQEALAIKPDYVEAHNNLGAALFQNGQTDEAIAQYQMAIAIQPGFADAHYNFGIALLNQGRIDEAILQYQKVLAIQPNHPKAENNLGNALIQKGRAEEAVMHWQKALAMQPGFAEADYNLGHYLLQKGRLDEAVIHFQKALAVQPGLVEAQNDLARSAWALATSPDAAVRNGTKAVELAQQADQLSSGKNPLMAATLAAAYAEAGKFGDAIATAQRALQLADGQKNATLVAALEAQLKLYQAGSPFHDTGASR